MAQEKKMNESAFDKVSRELDATAELIRTRQDEKQALMDSFEAERKRFRSGRISEAALASSVKKTNKELMRLDKQIREAIAKAGRISTTLREFASRQAPKVLRAHLSGIKSASSSKKKTSKKKAPKKAKAKKKSKAKPARPARGPRKGKAKATKKGKAKATKKGKARLSPKQKKTEMKLDRKYQKKR